MPDFDRFVASSLSLGVLKEGFTAETQRTERTQRRGRVIQHGGHGGHGEERNHSGEGLKDKGLSHFVTSWLPFVASSLRRFVAFLRPCAPLPLRPFPQSLPLHVTCFVVLRWRGVPRHPSISSLRDSLPFVASSLRRFPQSLSPLVP